MKVDGKNSTPMPKFFASQIRFVGERYPKIQAYLLVWLVAIPLATNAASSDNQPDRFPVLAGQIIIDDGSLHTVVLLDNKADFLNYCAGYRVAFIQSENEKTNPSGCWLPAGAPPLSRLINFRYTNIKTGKYHEFYIYPSQMERKIYEWRTERLFPITIATKTMTTPIDISELSEDEFNRQFKCPETFIDDDQSKTALADMLKWYAAHNSTVTAEGFVKYRIKTLEKHRCEVTLRNIRNAGK